MLFNTNISPAGVLLHYQNDRIMISIQTSSPYYNDFLKVSRLYHDGYHLEPPVKLKDDRYRIVFTDGSDSGNWIQEVIATVSATRADKMLLYYNRLAGTSFSIK